MTDIKLNGVVNAYIIYRSKRAEFKAIQRKELAELMQPFAVPLGLSILEARESKAVRIEDIATALGMKNRNFIYEMIKAVKDTPTRRDEIADQIADQIAETVAVTNSTDPNAPKYSVEKFEDGYGITLLPLGISYFVQMNRNGIVPVPNEAVTLPKQERDKLRDAIAYIESGKVGDTD